MHSSIHLLTYKHQLSLMRESLIYEHNTMSNCSISDHKYSLEELNTKETRVDKGCTGLLRI